MKKTLIALATLAATGAAFAQSTVSIYGQLDAGVYSIKGYTAGQSATVFGDGATFSNVLGFRGSEDLGGGLKANFQAETDIQTNNGGTSQHGLFRRQANVSVSGGFGDIKFGITMNPIIATNGALMPVAGNSVGTVTASALGYADFFTRNAITYTSPVINGLTAQIQHGFSQDTAAGTTDGSVTAGSLAYVNGPLSIRYAMQDRKGTTSATNVSGANPAGAAASTATSGWPTVSGSASSYDKKSSVLGARYTLGALSLGAAYISNEIGFATPVKVTATQVGAGYVMGANTIGVNYTTSESSTLTSLQLRHALSKRTNLIGTLGMASNAGTVGFAPVAFNTGSGPAPINNSFLGSLGNRGLNRDISGFGVALTHSF